jgi:hypothetical protein
MPPKHKDSSIAHASAGEQSSTTSSLPKTIRDILESSNLSIAQIGEIEAFVAKKDQEIKDMEQHCKRECTNYEYVANLTELQVGNEKMISQGLRERIKRLEQQLHGDEEAAN